MTSAAASLLAALFAQVTEPPPPRPAETFALDISEKRITKEGFAASTELSVGGSGAGILVQIGAGVSARAIDVVLRNVQGTVRFRADTSRLDAIRSLAPPPARPANPDSDQQ